MRRHSFHNFDRPSSKRECVWLKNTVLSHVYTEIGRNLKESGSNDTHYRRHTTVLLTSRLLATAHKSKEQDGETL